MGNQQTNLDLEYEDADSGLGSPFEANSSGTQSFFDNCEEPPTLESLCPAVNPNFTSTPIKIRTDIDLANTIDGLNTDLKGKEPPFNRFEQRRASIVRSNTIEIARSVKSVNKYMIDEENDEFDCNLPIGRSGHTNMSMISNSWSPNSTLTKTQIELVKSKSASESANTTPTKSYQLTSSLLSGMNFVGRVAKGVKDFYNEINPATLTGAIDVVVVKQEDGTYKSSPFHVRFGKLGVIRSKEKIVDIEINGQKVEDLHMVLGEAGEAFFIERVSDSGEVEYSNCDEFENCSLPSGTPIITSSVSHNCELSNIMIASQDENILSVETNNSNKLSQENVIKSNENEKLTKPISFSKSTPMIYDACDSSPLSTSINNKTNSPDLNSLQVAKPNLNFFSDGDITPELTSPVYSRPSTPKSDTEVEIAKFKLNNLPAESRQGFSDANQWNWNWGQFPERQKPKEQSDEQVVSCDKNNNLYDETSATLGQPTATNKQTSETSASIKSKDSKLVSSSKLLDGMLSLVKNSSNNTPDGIYLDDTDKLDSEVADLYLNQKSTNRATSNNPVTSAPIKISSSYPTQQLNDDDQESGNGQSLPQSPVNSPFVGEIQLSLCGFIQPSIHSQVNTSFSPPRNSSQTNNLLSISNTSVTNSQTHTPPSSPQPLTPTPSIQNLATLTSNSNLICSSPATSSSGLINNAIDSIYDDLFQQYIVSFDKFISEIATITQNPNLVIKINGQYMNWQSAAPIILSQIVFQRPLPTESIKSIMDVNMPKNAEKPAEVSKKVEASGSGWGKNLFYWGSKRGQATTTTTTTSIEQKVTTTTTKLSESEEYGAIFKEDWSKNQAEVKSETTEDIVTEVKKNACMDPLIPPKVEEKFLFKHRSNTTGVDFNEFMLKKDLYRKSTRLSSSILEKLDLKMGANEIEYSITTALQGTTRITSYIFMWNFDDKIIVSDIDGTITKSDVWGQVLPIFGRDWSQDGVADLFTAIERNKYKFMYLSARAIGQSRITRDLLKNINQNGFTLPEGPLLVTPTSLFVAFQKEVIERKPEEFKISCLSDIKALFPPTNEVFYAGYGNKPTDVTAYKAVGMPISRIFTINPAGEVKHEVSRTFQSSYSKLTDYVDLIFPPFKANSNPVKAEYDAFAYWKNTANADIDEEIKQVLLKEKEMSIKEKNKEKDKSKEKNKSKEKEVAKTTKAQSLNSSMQNNSNNSHTSESSEPVIKT